MQWLNDLLTWWRGLSDAAAFLYAIPFAVAAAALIADRLRTRGKGDRAQAARARAARPVTGEAAAAPDLR